MKINKKKINIKILKMRDGLEMVVLLAEIIEKAGENLDALTNKKSSVRLVALSKIIQDIPDIDLKIRQIVMQCTDIPKIHYDDLTFMQTIKILKRIMKVNKWYAFWGVANSLKLIGQDTFDKSITSGIIGEI